MQDEGTQSQSTQLPDAPVPNIVESAAWNRVQELSREDTITVRLRGGDSVRCVFDGATSRELYCSTPYGFAGEREFHFDRKEVEVVRQKHEHRNFMLMTLIGAGAGCGFFAVADSSNGASRTLNCMIGGGIGALGGSFIGLIIRPFIPGSLIYRRNKTP